MAFQNQVYDSLEEAVADRGPHEIVVADDDPAMVHLLQENLQELGYKVYPAFDGQMAVRLAHEHHPNLIILDVNMPLTSGLKAFEFLRTSAQTSRIPIIFITGELSKDVIPRIAGAPRVAHVKKPFDLESFNTLVREFLEQYQVVQ